MLQATVEFALNRAILTAIPRVLKGCNCRGMSQSVNRRWEREKENELTGKNRAGFGGQPGIGRPVQSSLREPCDVCCWRGTSQNLLKLWRD